RLDGKVPVGGLHPVGRGQGVYGIRESLPSFVPADVFQHGVGEDGVVPAGPDMLGEFAGVAVLGGDRVIVRLVLLLLEVDDAHATRADGCTQPGGHAPTQVDHVHLREIR